MHFNRSGGGGGRAAAEATVAAAAATAATEAAAATTSAATATAAATGTCYENKRRKEIVFLTKYGILFFVLSEVKEGSSKQFIVFPPHIAISTYKR